MNAFDRRLRRLECCLPPFGEPAGLSVHECIGWHLRRLGDPNGERYMERFLQSGLVPAGATAEDVAAFREYVARRGWLTEGNDHFNHLTER